MTSVANLLQELSSAFIQEWTLKPDVEYCYDFILEQQNYKLIDNIKQNTGKEKKIAE